MIRALPDAAIDAAAELLSRRTGLAFPAGRRRALADGIGKAVGRAGDLGAYLRRLAAEEALFDELVAEVTVGETYFFREPEQLATIRDRVLPDLGLAGRDGPMRVWSAGCASGEEPYTLAMLALEAGLGGRVHILATDVSRAALARAQRARYTRWSLRSTPDDSRTRYFRDVDGGFELVPAVRELVEFGYLNLATDAYPSLCHGLWGMDLILCRNVLIYLDETTIHRVAGRLLATLARDGWLVLGASDPPLADVVPCDVVITDSGLLYRRRAAEGHARRRDLERPLSSAAPPLEPLRPTTETTPQPLVPEPREAEPVVPAVPESQPAETWVLQVRSAANRGNLEAAGKACIAGLEAHPACAELIYLHGLLLVQQGLLNQAATAFRQALYLDRGLALAHLTLGQTLARLGDHDGAGRSLRNATRVLLRLPAEAPVSAADGEAAGRLAEMARVHLGLLGDRHE